MVAKKKTTKKAEAMEAEDLTPSAGRRGMTCETVFKDPMDALKFLDTYDYEKENNSKPFTTGMIPIDILLDGGLTKGNMVMFYSAEGVGKTTICVQAIKSLMDQGLRVLYIDVESGLKSQMGAFGLWSYFRSRQLQVADTFKTVGQTDTIFKGMFNAWSSGIQENIDKYCYDVVVVDSISQLTDEGNLKRLASDLKVGGDAGAITRLIKNMRLYFADMGVITLLINQERANLDATTPYSPKTKLAGCKASKYTPDVLIKLAKTTSIKALRTTINGREETVIGSYIKASASKNRKGNPDIGVSMPFIYGKGVSNLDFVVDLMKKKGYITNGGAMFKTSLPYNKETPDGITTVKGAPAMRKHVADHFEEITEILENNGEFTLMQEESVE